VEREHDKLKGYLMKATKKLLIRMLFSFLKRILDPRFLKILMSYRSNYTPM